MSYLVLARRYRPQTFKEVVGQTHVVKTLINAIKQGKLSHALLFSGIKGTGKTTIARIIAKALNCQNLIDGYEPCNECTNCIEINKGIFVDVIEIDAASNRGIDQIREIIENLKFAPAKGKAKVYIIDEAHMLTKEASNALLKSLEEPPSHVYFILATTEPNKILPTILSRCQRYDFRRLDLPLLVKYLKEICNKENYEIEEEALKLIAKEAQGSLRDALSLLDQAMAYGTRTKEDVIYAFGWHEAILVEELAEILLEKNLKRALQTAQKIYEQGIDLIYLMEKLTEFFRELLVIKAFPKESQYNFQNPVLRDLILENELEDIFLVFQSLLKDLENLRRSNYPQLQFELSLVRICEYQKLVPLRKIIEKLDQISSSNFSFTPEQFFNNIASSETEKITEPVTIYNKSKTWENFIKDIEKESPALYGFISNLPEPEIKSENIVLKIDEALTKSPYFSVSKEKIQSYFNKPLKLEVKNNRKDTIEEIKERPEVKNILKVFSAKIAYIQPILKE
ncbi:DNA polymerase III subunit gamma/tau [Thermodesulfobacterium hydrogeniphilum]|uniref:DNA polymerase III subunit gamma/tau n=1 Tax=Thermodesulfobacterium hydrogeniphilum TaxID=161156 RepID=UPI00068C0B4D|nr:DNA polymerase III subunit gamma/tau [Thermodesulfobacterium hydrogeniphilum]